ncbi:MAG: hypothetical protein EBE86_024270 [Hormoscilla sp. GUM202]|nr:hypothetical protein [Hormoscilla sp. GUM202]
MLKICSIFFTKCYNAIAHFLSQHQGNGNRDIEVDIKILFLPWPDKGDRILCSLCYEQTDPGKTRDRQMLYLTINCFSDNICAIIGKGGGILIGCIYQCAKILMS